MDMLAGLLDGPRARGAFLLRSILDSPWSLKIQDEAPLTVVAVMRGEASVVPDGGEATRLYPGDVAVMRGPDHYVVADDPATPTSVVIHPGQVCKTVNGEDLAMSMALGVRTWGNSPHGSTMLLTGSYEEVGEISQRLLDSLPQMVHIPADSWDTPLVPLLAEEIGKDDCGQEAVLDRLLDLLLIASLRTWFNRAGVEAPSWYRADADPIVGPALRMLQNNPEHPWTVANLASAVGVSRAALARRFTELMGEPPMKFLTEWRLALAADLLREPGTTVGAVAQQVGYATPFALSTAFKRVRGVSPQQHRLATGAAS